MSVIDKIKEGFRGLKVDSLHQTALNLAAKNKHEKALKYYKLALKLDPNRVNLLIDYIRTLIALDMNNEATIATEHLEKTWPEHGKNVIPLR